MTDRLVGMVLCTLFVMNAIGQGITFHAKNWDEASAMAKKEDKLIFIDAYTTWCAPCKVMDEYVFTHELGGDLFNQHYINLKMDMEQDLGPLFGSRYAVSTYPTMLFLTWDGTMVHRTVGFQNIEKLVHEGRQALKPYKKDRALNQRFEEGDRGSDFLYHLTFHRLKNQDDSYLDIVPLYLESSQDWSNDETMGYIFNFVSDFDSEMFHHMAENKFEYAELVGDQVFNEKFNYYVQAALHNDGKKISLDRREEIYRIAYPAIANDMIYDYKLTTYLDAGDTSNYALTLYEHYTDRGQDDFEGILEHIDVMSGHLHEVSQQNQIYQWRLASAANQADASAYFALGYLMMKRGDFEGAKAQGRLAKQWLKDQDQPLSDYKRYKKKWKAAKKGQV